MLLLLLLISAPGPGFIHWQEAITHPPAPAASHSGPRPTPLQPGPDSPPIRRIYGYLPYWVDERWLHYDLLTHIGIFDVTLNPDGSITNDNNFPARWAAAIDRAHRNGVKCEMVATCFGWYNIHHAIRAPTAIPNLVALATAAGMDGINIDFEEILPADRDTVVRFMQELSRACRSAGLELTMATMPLDPANAYDFAALANTTDGLFIMGYNYHWQGGPEAGPVAPLTGWPFYGNLQMTLNLYLNEIGNGSKLYLGLPYYGFQWPTRAKTTHSATAGYGEALYYRDAPGRAAAYGYRWDAESQTPWYAFNNGGWNQGWFDDDTSLLLKYQEVHRHNLLGTGIWALGYDGARPELWAALRESFNPPLAAFTNGDCETWYLDTLAVPSDTSANPAGWYEGRKARYRRETGIVHSGSASIGQQPDSLGYPWPVRSSVFQDVRVTAGSLCEFRGWAYKDDGRGNRLQLAIEWYTANHEVIASASSAELVQDSSAWVELTTDPVVAPAGTESARLNLKLLGFGGFAYWDDLSFGTGTAVAEPVAATPSSVVRHNANLPFALCNLQSSNALFDATGRRVSTTTIRPGICFFPTRTGVTKLIIAH